MIDLRLGDCLEILPTIPSGSVDAVVTDPPAGLAFMGKDWDTFRSRGRFVDFLAPRLAECLRVAKPGARMLCWAIPRTSHWTGTAIEDAGWEIVDVVTHIGGQGFPKSLNISKTLKEQGKSCQCRKDADEYPSSNDGGLEHVEAEVYSESEDLRGLRAAVDSEECDSGETEQGLLSGVRQPTNRGRELGQETTGPDLPPVRQAVPAEGQAGESPGEVPLLRLSVRSGGEGSRSGLQGEPQAHCCNRPQGMDSGQRCGLSAQDERGEQPIMEGRGHVQAEQGELRRAEVYPVSGGPEADGAGGRLRDGASAGDGPDGRANPRKGRGRASSGPCDPEQRPEQPGTLAEQRDTQGGGAWPACDRCGKPTVPDGIGTALKPAVEFWFLARKPLDGTYADNVLKHGTGGLNIDACRVGTADDRSRPPRTPNGIYGNGEGTNLTASESHPAGRWPANLALSHSEECRCVGTKRVKPGNGSGRTGMRTAQNGVIEFGLGAAVEPWGAYVDEDGLETVAEWRCVEGCPVAELDRQSGERPGCKSPSAAKCESKYRPDQGAYQPQGPIYPDSGGASRFFATFGYYPKASRANRGQDNRHPTVKNTDMMRWLCRLIVPEGGIVLDPFMGSGSTLIAAEAEGFSAIGIDSDPESVATARRRWANKLAETPLFSQDLTPCEST
jgi:hypothetical protein